MKRDQVEKLLTACPTADHVNYPGLVRERLGFILEQLDAACEAQKRPRDNFHVLDAGCGTGKLSLPLAAAGYRVTALDNGQASLDFLQQHNRWDHLKTIRFDLIHGDYASLDGGWDAIIVAAILEHLADPVTVLRQLVERARPGCLVLGEVPNDRGAAEAAHDIRARVKGILGQTSFYQSISQRWRIRQANDATDTVSLTDTPHIFPFFSARVLDRVLRDAGLEQVRIVNFNLLVGVPLIHRLVYRSAASQILDARLARWMPLCLGNGWCFTARKPA